MGKRAEHVQPMSALCRHTTTTSMAWRSAPLSRNSFLTSTNAGPYGNGSNVASTRAIFLATSLLPPRRSLRQGA